MNRVIVIMAAIVLFITFNMAYAKDYEISKKSGDYNVQIVINKNPPVTGKNNMDITIKDVSGKDVADASVAVDYGMPAMPGMGAMNYKSIAGWKAGKYSTVLDFSMSGAWFVNIKITRAGTTQTVKLNVDVK